MKSKSTSYKQYHSEVDDILSKLHSNNLQGNPITPADDEWINTRERLIKAKMTNGRYNFFPINWQIAEHLIIDELCSRENVVVEHIEFKKERN